MMDRKKRKPLSRGGKTVRNLLLAALAGVLVWINAGAPLPPEQEFQRLVQTNFLEDEVQFLGNFETSGLHWGAGLTDQWLVLGALDRGRMELWPREGDGPVVAPAPDDFARWSEIAFVAADAPEGTASAQLTIDLSCWYTHTGTATNGTWSYWASEDQDWGGLTPTYWENTYTLEGEPLKDGAFLFYLPELDPLDTRDIELLVRSYLADWDLYLSQVYQENPNRRSAACTLSAVFYNRAGSELGRAELTDIQGGV